jgi:hypothetical protein
MANFSVMTKAPGKIDPPFNPYVYVVLSEHFKDFGGNITLTPHLMTEVEIDEAVDLLIKQLEKTRNKAKKGLQKVKEQNRISAR